jgi:hypothetical protein
VAVDLAVRYSSAAREAIIPIGAKEGSMYWATTKWRVTESNPELTDALRAWMEHCATHHPQIKEVRCYRYNGGTTYVWQEGFEDFNRYQEMIDGEDESCAAAQQAVFRFAVPGTRSSRIWSDAV